jgi:hypothetical protein
MLTPAWHISTHEELGGIHPALAIQCYQRNVVSFRSHSLLQLVDRLPTSQSQSRELWKMLF